MDSDGDAVWDGIDLCADTPKGWPVDAKGCPLDSDADGVADGKDSCPEHAEGLYRQRARAARRTPTAMESARGSISARTRRRTAASMRAAARSTPTATVCATESISARARRRECRWMRRGVRLRRRRSSPSRPRSSCSSACSSKPTSATLKPESTETLDKVAASLKDFPDVKIQVAGHTDNTGSAEHNMKLSEARAATVMNYLISKGVIPAMLSAKGYGKNEPLADNKTAGGSGAESSRRAASRRVEQGHIVRRRRKASRSRAFGMKISSERLAEGDRHVEAPEPLDRGVEISEALRERVAATSAPKPPVTGASCSTSAFERLAHRRRSQVATSHGSRVRRSMTSTEKPSSASVSAACNGPHDADAVGDDGRVRALARDPSPCRAAACSSPPGPGPSRTGTGPCARGSSTGFPSSKRRKQQPLGVERRGGRDDLQAGHLREPRFHVLRVERTRAHAAADGEAQDDGKARAPPVVRLREVVDDLVEAAGDEIAELHLEHRRRSRRAPTPSPRRRRPTR